MVIRAVSLFMIALAVIISTGEASPLGERIEKALGSDCLNREKTAVRVIDAETGEVLYDKNGSTPLVPASVMKLFTTASALHYLGPAYRFTTDVLRTGAFEDGAIKGDLIIRGGGDPKLTPEELWIIAREIKARGVSQVTGDVVVDDSFFDGRRLAPKWSERRTQRAYDAKLGALSVNFNTVTVKIHPGRRAGDPLLVTLEPESDYINLVNKGTTTSSGRNSVSARRVKSGVGARLVISGSMRMGDDGKTFYVNIDNPLKYAAEAFRAALAREGIEIKGSVRAGVAGNDALLLLTHKSAPLSVILRELNRYSSNFVAEQITKTIAAETNGEPGAHNEAITLLKKLLAELGVDTAGTVFTDGSGLSRKNRLTAKALTGLLAAMKKRFDIGPDFIASLGIMGVDGSVKERMENSPASARARAKTGTLAGVSSLAGYVAGNEGGLYAFAIMSNENGCYYKKADELEDEIVTAIHLFDAERQ